MAALDRVVCLVFPDFLAPLRELMELSQSVHLFAAALRVALFLLARSLLYRRSIDWELWGSTSSPTRSPLRVSGGPPDENAAYSSGNRRATPAGP